MGSACSLPDLVARFGGELLDDNGVLVSGVAPVERAGPQEIAFVARAKYLREIETTQAGALILPPEGRASTRRPRIIMDRRRWRRLYDRLALAAARRRLHSQQSRRPAPTTQLDSLALSPADRAAAPSRRCPSAHSPRCRPAIM